MIVSLKTQTFMSPLSDTDQFKILGDYEPTYLFLTQRVKLQGLKYKSKIKTN